MWFFDVGQLLSNTIFFRSWFRIIPEFLGRRSTTGALGNLIKQEKRRKIPLTLGLKCLFYHPDFGPRQSLCHWCARPRRLAELSEVGRCLSRSATISRPATDRTNKLCQSWSCQWRAGWSRARHAGSSWPAWSRPRTPAWWQPRAPSFHQPRSYLRGQNRGCEASKVSARRFVCIENVNHNKFILCFLVLAFIFLFRSFPLLSEAEREANALDLKKYN